MNYDRISFYKDRIAINLLAKDRDNAVEVVEALDGNALVEGRRKPAHERFRSG